MAVYLDAIVKASRSQTVFSVQDPQIDMLVKVGKRHVDVLVEKYGSACHRHFNSALGRLAGAEHKDLIIESLGVTPDLVEVVVAKGWVKDARQMLMDGLAGRPHYLPTKWIEAAAQLKDPATYEDLAFYFVHGMNRSSTYDAIKTLPGFDLEAPIAEAWRLKLAGAFGFPLNLAGDDEALVAIAFAHGYEEAIAPTFLCLKKSEAWLQRRARDAILAHTEATGSDEEILAWYAKRQGRLRWDPEQRKYRELVK